MEQSILTSTKKILGLGSDYSVFDLDIITHINATFAVLHQLGVGPTAVYAIESADETWDEFTVPTEQLNLIKTYFYLRVRNLFDPPTTSFAIEAMNNQIQEFEWRISANREVTEWTTSQAALIEDETI